MNSRSITLFMFILLLSPCASASLVGEKISVGPIDVGLPRWHQGITLEDLSLSVNYLPNADEPATLSSIEMISIDADFGPDGRLDISMGASDVCEETWIRSNNGTTVEGRRCLEWDAESYVVVTFKANFKDSSLAIGLEYLAMTSVGIRGNPSATITLCNWTGKKGARGN